jgi:DNA polymerase-1
VLSVLFKIERNGVLLNTDQLAAQTHQLGREMLEIEQRPTRPPGSRSI